MRLNRYLNSLLAILALGTCLATPVLAQDAYPSKPLKVIVPFPAAGPAISCRFRLPLAAFCRPLPPALPP